MSRKPKSPADGWDDASDDELYSLSDLDRTPLAILRRRARYALVNTGMLPVIVVGKRRYVRRGAIREYLRANERRLGGER